MARSIEFGVSAARVAYIDIMVLGQVDSNVQRHARETSLKGLLQAILLILLVAVYRVSLRYAKWHLV